MFAQNTLHIILCKQERKAFQVGEILQIFLFETFAEKELIFDIIKPVEPIELIKPVEPMVTIEQNRPCRPRISFIKNLQKPSKTFRNLIPIQPGL